jgi:1-acyl-sn-glycerol-3-phosphate acyltransferase
MEAMGMVFIDRGRRSRAAAGIDAAASLLRGDASVVSFPGGTRRPPGEPLAFKAAAFAPALAAGVPVVPVAIHGTHVTLPPGGRIRPGGVIVCVGEPIPTAGLPMSARDEVARAAEEAVARMVARLAEHQAAAAASLTESELAAS